VAEVNSKVELQPSEVVLDVRTFGDKFKEFVGNAEYVSITLFGIGGGIIFIPAIADIFFFLALILAIISFLEQKKTGLPVCLPQSSGLIDPNNIPPGGGKPGKAKGIVYMGREKKTGKQIWLSDTQLRTHMLVMGTTGSGKTEKLLSLVYNSLIHDSGFVYIDGKADSSLYAKIFTMARLMGREDDILLINFQTGAKDIFGAQPSKISNTLNPWAFGSSGMLSQLTVSLMQQEDGKGGDVWENRAISFVEALMRPLVFMRDRFGIPLDVGAIRNYFLLDRIEEMVYDFPEKMSRSLDERASFEESLAGLNSYLENLPGYEKKNRNKHNSEVLQQHGFITMQLVRTFNSLADIYGYIMKTPLPEIDLRDVFLNRRILVVLLPALEKSPQELTALGRIIVASLKATMAVGLGAEVEGNYKRVIKSKPTEAPSPFVAVMDEYGYYAVKGFAVVAAQARSLGFSAIFAGQDLPAFEKASKEEAESTIGNTTTQFCGKLQCTKTYEFFSKLAGEGFFAKSRGFEIQTNLSGVSHLADNNSSIEKVQRVTFDELVKQKSGEWTMFRDGKIIRINGFYANPDDDDVRVSEIRTNHFIRVGRPEMNVAIAVKSAIEKTTDFINNGFDEVTDEFAGTRTGIEIASRLIDAFSSSHGAIISAINALCAAHRGQETMKGNEILLPGNGYSEDADSVAFDGGSLDDFINEIGDEINFNSPDPDPDIPEETSFDAFHENFFDEQDDAESVQSQSQSREVRRPIRRRESILNRDKTQKNLHIVEQMMGGDYDAARIAASETVTGISGASRFPTTRLPAETADKRKEKMRRSGLAMIEALRKSSIEEDDDEAS